MTDSFFPLRIEGAPDGAPDRPPPFSGLEAARSPGGIRWTFRTAARRVFGLGERFDAVDQKGRVVEAVVEEKFTEQGPLSYYPVPFFFTELGFSMEVEGSYPVVFDFGAAEADLFTVDIRCGDEEPPALVVRFGSPAALVASFVRSTGLPCLPPQWTLGPWISANRWNSRAILMEQVDRMEELGIPATVVVLEAWSDEGGFFAWNDGGLWPDPAGMIAELGRRGLRLVLWQVPVCKRLADCPEGAASEREGRALAEAEAEGYLVRRADGSVYAIPEGRWFGGSPIPDFTDPAACDWYFSKRRHLLDQGVAGFKTDGGEFVHDDSLRFHDGRTGRAMRSGYTASYLEAYGRFVGADRVLFSRAGWTGSGRWSLHWAGDQKSSWPELRAQLAAGLSAGLSGIAFWTFDIGGFAGALPDAELYLRSFAFAVFAPLMQWHSEPVYGQFADIMKGSGGINDRSPWNIGTATGDGRVVPACRALSRLRMALLPYLALCARRTVATGLPVMRHLVLDFPDDPRAAAVCDEYLLGDSLLVAPVVERGATGRSVYFPTGRWIDISDGTVLEGPCDGLVEAPPGTVPVFRRGDAKVSLDEAWIDGTTPRFLSGGEA